MKKIIINITLCILLIACGKNGVSGIFSQTWKIIEQRPDSARALLAKIDIPSLTDKEQAEFITYWLPRMAVNEYNRVEFLTGGQVDALMPLNIVPEPDNVLRVYMLFAPCSSELALMLKPQELPVLTREGFTVLEWGGSDLGSR